ncbi:hypothetical protein CSC2_07350 [Clostridium zeae]|uniref:DUF2007 domain-containing protein n=1 Tax=Clostridium zeae TaxID=2759022 RepID=A0ABQ1E645_9CLOT|nr:hypothetical protein CSC2_07350 [Clostridium zeae]
MNNYIIKESDDEEAKLIIDKLVNYNLSIVPQTQEQPFIWINRVIRNFYFQAKDLYIKQ